MPALIAALLIAGALLSGFGLLGYWANATTAPDAYDLTLTRKIATAGQSALITALQLPWRDPGQFGTHTAPIAAVTLAILAAGLATKIPVYSPARPG